MQRHELLAAQRDAPPGARMASVWASIGSLFSAKQSQPADIYVAETSSRQVSSRSYLGKMSTSSAIPRGSTSSFEESHVAGDEAAYGRAAYTTPTLQQNGFDSAYISPGSQYPPSQSPFVSPASASRLHLNGIAGTLADSPRAPTTSYPSLRQTFNRIAQILGPLYPELVDTLGNPVLREDLSALGDAFGRIYSLPRDVRESMACHDGQDIYSLSTSGSYRERKQRGLVWGLWLMTTDEIGDDYRHWRTLERKEMRGEQPVDDPFAPAGKPLQVPGMASCPAGWVREEYSHPGWIPLLTDGLGNYIGIDLDPPSRLEADKAESGAWQALASRPGQVIAYGREIDCKTVLFPGWGPDGGWARFLSNYADDLERGEFGTLGLAGDADLDEAPTADGLGEVGYFNEGNDRLDQTSFAEGGRKDRYRDSAPSGGSWRLKGDYAEMNAIEALCWRSRQRWAEVGLYASTAKPRLRKKSTATLDLERSESQRTARPASPQLMTVDTVKVPPPVAVTPELSTATQPEIVPSSPRLTVSPPTPNPPRPSLGQVAPLAERTQARRLVPPPEPLDLPTMGEMDAFSLENLPPPVSTASSPRSSSDRRRSPRPDILPMSRRSSSPRLPPERKPSFGLSGLGLESRPAPIQVVVQGGENIGSPVTTSPRPPSESAFEKRRTSLDDVSLRG